MRMKVRKAGGGQWGAVRRRVQKCGVAALHRHVRDELLQVIVGDVSWSAGSESQPCSSKAAVYEDSSCLREEGGGGLRHVHVHVHAHAHCDVCVGGRRVGRLAVYGFTFIVCSLLAHIPLCNRKLLYIRPFLFAFAY